MLQDYLTFVVKINVFAFVNMHTICSLSIYLIYIHIHSPEIVKWVQFVLAELASAV